MRTNNGNKGPTPKIYEGTDTAIRNIIEKEEIRNKAEQLLKKCKQNDKGKKEYPVPGSPIKTWFLCRTKEQAEKRINQFKNTLIVRK